MAKIARLLFLILFTCSMLSSATNYKKELYSYDKKIEVSNDDELLKVHNAIRNIYIKAIINNDSLLKKESLTRLIKTSNLLKLDSTGYKKELSTIQKTLPKKKVTVKKIVKPIVSTKHKTDRSKHPARVKSIIDKGDRLVLSFDKRIATKDIKSFQIKDKGSFREVFNIKAILPFTPHLKTPKELDALRVAQFDSKTIRVVFKKDTISKSKIATKGTKVELFYSTKKRASYKRKEKKTNSISPSHKTIVIDAGHGGKDAGAVGTKTRYEKNAVLQIALRTGRVLQKRGYKVYYTRTRDKFIKLKKRTQYANKKKADFFLSIHANASNKKNLHGIETFYLSPARSKRSKSVASRENKSVINDMDYYTKQTYLHIFNRTKITLANKLALDVQQSIINRLKSKYSNIRDGGVRKAPFWVLVGAQMPAILIETGYITNKMERKRIFNSHYQNLIANGIADGIDSYLMKYEF